MNQQNADFSKHEELRPPAELSEEERWIVRLHGKDVGPFSSKSLYPRLLIGEIDPETMLLDEHTFSRRRLRDIAEFQPYLDRHNTFNPILLKEQKAQERDEFWEKKGKRRVYFTIFLLVLLAVGGFYVWRTYIYKSNDVYLTDGDHEFSFKGFTGVKKRKGVRTNWSWTPPRRAYRGGGGGGSRKGKRSGGGSGGSGPSATAFDFSKGGGGGIPRAQINSIVRRRIGSVFGCFKQRMEADSRFTGGSIRFVISGRRVRNVSVQDTDYSSRILVSCIRRRASRWSFPAFPGSAIVHFPVYVRKRRSRW